MEKLEQFKAILIKKNIKRVACINIIFSFISEKEVSLVIFNTNKQLRKQVKEYFEIKNNSKEAISKKIIKFCVTDLKPFFCNLNNLNKILSNHSENLEKDISFLLEKYNPFTIYTSLIVGSRHFYSKLVTLDLTQMNIGYDGVLLISNLIKNSQVLSSLFLGYNSISDDGCAFLKTPLSYNNSINTLNLECNGITNIGFGILSDTLISMKTLKN